MNRDVKDLKITARDYPRDYISSHKARGKSVGMKKLKSKVMDVQ